MNGQELSAALSHMPSLSEVVVDGKPVGSVRHDPDARLIILETNIKPALEVAAKPLRQAKITEAQDGIKRVD